MPQQASHGTHHHAESPLLRELHASLGQRRRPEDVAHLVHGVDPVTGGRTGPRDRVRPVPFRPTPELVHGVTVGDPVPAGVLRSAGFFSGRPPRPAARELAPRTDRA